MGRHDRDGFDPQHPQQGPGGPQPYGQAPYGAPPSAGWQRGDHGEPEYFGGSGPAPAGPDPYAANNPGHTQSFSLGESPDGGYPPPYGGPGPDQGDYGYGQTYAAGQPTAPPVGPRLHWKQLLSGIVLRPDATFWQMRDHTMWGPAITVTFLYGLLAVFGLDQAREDVLNTTLSSSIPYILTTGIAVTLSSLVLGAVTHTLARQFGGAGAWAPTIGLTMLIMSLTDAPRLLFALFMGGDASLVQVLGWATWVAAGALLTLMVSRSHDLPWPRALGACSLQLVALLVLLKLGTL